MPARSPAKSMKAPAKLPAISPRQSNMRSKCGSGRRSRCSSRISSASLGWEDCDYVDHAVQMTNSSSQQPPKTVANWPRSFLHRSKRAKPDRKGARALNSIPLSASAIRCFSTESADSGHSLRLRRLLAAKAKRTFMTLRVYGIH